MFNIWIRPADFPVEEVPLFGEIGGIKVYGYGRTEYLVWRAHGRIVSIASFSKDYAGLPTGDDLKGLVQASIEA